MKIQNLWLIVAIAGVFTFSSCENEEFTTTVENSETTEVSEEIKAGLQKLGYNVSDPEVYQRPDGRYVVSGNTILSYSDNDILNAEVTKQRRYRDLVSCQNRRLIRVKSNLNRNNTRLLQRAINRWNNANVARIRFRMVSGNQDIVANSITNANFIAIAGIPFEGKPGDLIELDQRQARRFSDEEVTDILTSLLGTTIGLAFNQQRFDTNDSFLINNTPRRDRNSIMNVPLPGDGSARITENDKRAVRQIYRNCN